jgi:hypothetical protein
MANVEYTRAREHALLAARLGVDLTGTGDTDRRQRVQAISERADHRLEGIEDRRGTAVCFGERFGL